METFRDDGAKRDFFLLALFRTWLWEKSCFLEGAMHMERLIVNS